VPVDLADLECALEWLQEASRPQDLRQDRALDMLRDRISVHVVVLRDMEKRAKRKAPRRAKGTDLNALSFDHHLAGKTEVRMVDLPRPPREGREDVQGWGNAEDPMAIMPERVNKEDIQTGWSDKPSEEGKEKPEREGPLKIGAWEDERKILDDLPSELAEREYEQTAEEEIHPNGRENESIAPDALAAKENNWYFEDSDEGAPATIALFRLLGNTQTTGRTCASCGAEVNDRKQQLFSIQVLRREIGGRLDVKADSFKVFCDRCSQALTITTPNPFASVKQAEPDWYVTLTDRERRVLELRNQGLTEEKVALRLGLSGATAVSRILKAIDQKDKDYSRALARSGGIFHSAPKGFPGVTVDEKVYSLSSQQVTGDDEKKAITEHISREASHEGSPADAAQGEDSIPNCPSEAPSPVPVCKHENQKFACKTISGSIFVCLDCGDRILKSDAMPPVTRGDRREDQEIEDWREKIKEGYSE